MLIEENLATIPVLITFSGVDGSGKSTQIESLVEGLHARGLRAKVLAFWDDVVVAARYREGFVHQVYKSQRGIGQPGKPVNRRDKNMRGWYLTVARHMLYLLDALNLRRVTARELRRKSADVIVFDRYIYDELANLNLANPLTRLFAGVIERLVPRPTLAFLLDADPAAAYARKPEYPVEFMTQCRQAYLGLAAQLGTMTVVPALTLAEAKHAVLASTYQCLGADVESGSMFAA